MNVAETCEERSAAQERDDPKKREHHAEDEAGADRQLDENAEKMQAEEQD